MNPGAQYKIPNAVGSSTMSMKPGGHFYQHQMMGGSRFPPKFPIKQEPFDPAAMATPALTLYRCSTGKSMYLMVDSERQVTMVVYNR
jgi:hypothetical protein